MVVMLGLQHLGAVVSQGSASIPPEGEDKMGVALLLPQPSGRGWSRQPSETFPCPRSGESRVTPTYHDWGWSGAVQDACVGSTQTGRETRDSLWAWGCSVSGPPVAWSGLGEGPVAFETRKEVTRSSSLLGPALPGARGGQAGGRVVGPCGAREPRDPCPGKPARREPCPAGPPSHAPAGLPAPGISRSHPGAQLALVFPMFFQLCGMG